jgi:hypothetical protein
MPIGALLAPIITAGLTAAGVGGAAGTIAGIAAPIIGGAGLGAITSGLTGGNAGLGALTGAVGGGITDLAGAVLPSLSGAGTDIGNFFSGIGTDIGNLFGGATGSGTSIGAGGFGASTGAIGTPTTGDLTAGAAPSLANNVVSGGQPLAGGGGGTMASSSPGTGGGAGPGSNISPVGGGGGGSGGPLGGADNPTNVTSIPVGSDPGPGGSTITSSVPINAGSTITPTSNATAPASVATYDYVPGGANTFATPAVGNTGGAAATPSIAPYFGGQYITDPSGAITQPGVMNSWSTLASSPGTTAGTAATPAAGGNIASMIGQGAASLLKNYLQQQQTAATNAAINAPLVSAMTGANSMGTMMAAPATTGVLPAGEEQALALEKRQMDAAATSQAVTTGMTGSTMERDAKLNDIARIEAQRTGIANQMLTQAGSYFTDAGKDAAALTGQLQQQQNQITAQNNQNANSLSQLSGALAKLPTNQTTTNTNAQTASGYGNTQTASGYGNQPSATAPATSPAVATPAVAPAAPTPPAAPPSSTDAGYYYGGTPDWSATV